MGYKEIEVSFPVANQTEFDFTRRLIEDDNAIPADVTIQVCSPCRRDTIARSIESLKGAKSATLFTYIPTSDNLRDNVLEISEEEGLQRAIDCTRYARSLTKDDPSTQGTHWTFGFGFEDFGNTRIELALRYSEAILSAWNPSTENPMIQGFATSVEVTAPNVFADQIECFLRKHTQRHRFILSVHPHNDRGCGVAAAELGCLAGADSIEGCLFGNGERAGNVDLVTLGLNLFTQGIDPGIDFSFLPLVRDTVEDITKIPVHPRAPYAGEYYFRAFSGLHQNAIIKSLDKRKNQQRISSTKRCGENASDQSWKVSYLPMDPTDIGLGYESIIKINSQSGGRGVAWSLRDGLGIELPRDLQIEFSKAVKTKSEVLGREVNRGEVADLFVEKYGIDGFQSRMLAIRTTDPKSDPVIIDLEQLRRQGTNDEGGFLFSVAAYISHIGVSDVSIIDTVKQAITMEDTTTPKTACYTQCRFSGTEKVCWGVGISDDERTAEINSILSALQKSGLVDYVSSINNRSSSYDSQACHTDVRSSEISHPAYSDRNTPIVTYGMSFIETIDKYVNATFHASRIYVLASSSLIQRSNAVADMKQQLGNRIVGIRVGLRPHTLWSEVLEIVRECGDCGADLIVTLGGGKLTDAAKAASIALANDMNSFDDLTSIPNMASLPNVSPRLRREDIKASRVPVISVPTTLSGAEYSNHAGTTNDLTHVKWHFVPPIQSPSLVILDPSLTTTIPIAKWISSGVRAIDHCVETLCHPRCDGESYKCAKSGLEALLPGLLQCRKLHHSEELEGRLQCQLGAMNSMAFVHRGLQLGASHGIGHMLGPMGVRHGETSCVLMPAVARYNAAHGLENRARQEAVADIIWSSPDIVSDALRSRGLTRGEADLSDMLDAFITELGMPRTLQEVGIERCHLEELAERSLKDDLLRTNPVLITSKEQVLEILEKVAG